MSIGTEGGGLIFPSTAAEILLGNIEESALPSDSFQTQADVQLLLIYSRFLQLVT